MMPIDLLLMQHTPPCSIKRWLRINESLPILYFNDDVTDLKRTDGRHHVRRRKAAVAPDDGKEGIAADAMNALNCVQHNKEKVVVNFCVVVLIRNHITRPVDSAQLA